MASKVRIQVSKLLDSTDVVPSGKDKPDSLRAALRNALLSNQAIEVDLSGLRGLSPSFAYEAFGKLVDEFGANVLSRFLFINDQLHLEDRVRDAVSRRLEILKPSA